MKRKLDEVEDEESTDKKVKADNNGKSNSFFCPLKIYNINIFFCYSKRRRGRSGAEGI